MDLLYLIHNDSIITLDPVTESIIMTYSIFCDAISTLSSLFLITYWFFKKNEKVRDHHSPIFYQLFFSATVILSLRGIVRFTSIFATFQVSENPFLNVVILTMQLITVIGIQVLITIGDILIIVVLMFSLLAAAQKFAIVYGKKYRILITGKYLKVLIVIVWLFSIFYFGAIQGICLAKDIDANTFCLENTSIIVLAFRTVFLISMVIIIGIYYHFYKLITQVSISSKRSLLYQFVPIHVVLTTYTAIGFISDLISRFSYFDLDAAPFITVFTGVCISPLIPIVIAFSYIASVDNLRKWARARLLLVLRGLSS